jgi:four helix bundle protein
VVGERIKSYEDLRVWQDAMQLAECVYAFCQHLPKDKIYGLVSQMKRAAVSVPSNIAEGSERNNTRELIQFLYVARGSLAELQTQIKLARRLHKIEGVVEMEEIGVRISRGLANLIKSLQKPSPATRHLPPVTLTE